LAFGDALQRGWSFCGRNEMFNDGIRKQLVNEMERTLYRRVF